MWNKPSALVFLGIVFIGFIFAAACGPAKDDKQYLSPPFTVTKVEMVKDECLTYRSYGRGGIECTEYFTGYKYIISDQKGRVNVFYRLSNDIPVGSEVDLALIPKTLTDTL